jgi:hypothetical protein
MQTQSNMKELEWYFTTHLYIKRQQLLYPNIHVERHLTDLTNNIDATQAILHRLNVYPPSKRELAITLRNLGYSYPKIQKMIHYSPNYIARVEKIRHQYVFPLHELLKLDTINKLDHYIQAWNDFRTFAKKHGKDIF